MGLKELGEILTWFLPNGFRNKLTESKGFAKARSRRELKNQNRQAKMTSRHTTEKLLKKDKQKVLKTSREENKRTVPYSPLGEQ